MAHRGANVLAGTVFPAAGVQLLLGRIVCGTSSMFRADAAAGDTVTLDQVPKAVMATVPDEQCGAGDWIRRHHAVANADDGTPLIPVAPAKAKKEK